jgi:hypothetical protein
MLQLLASTNHEENLTVWMYHLVATSLATEKISVATQLATQMQLRCKSDGLRFY